MGEEGLDKAKTRGRVIVEDEKVKVKVSQEREVRWMSMRTKYAMLPARYRVGIGRAGRPRVPVECLLCSRRLDELLEEVLGEAADLSPPPNPKKREKNGLLPVPDCGGDGDCVVEVAVYRDWSGA